MLSKDRFSQKKRENFSQKLGKAFLETSPRCVEKLIHEPYDKTGCIYSYFVFFFLTEQYFKNMFSYTVGGRMKVSLDIPDNLLFRNTETICKQNE